MKTRFLQKILLLGLFLVIETSLFAQPANDDCANPMAITVAVDEASAIQVAGDTRATVDATTVAGPSVCSGSWYTDDVWYSFTVGATIPENGITIKTYFTGTGDDLANIGMAVYTNDCADTNRPLACFTDEPGRRDILARPECLTVGETFLVRVWSAGSPVDDSGTFMIAAFDAEPLPSEEVVVWSEIFALGLGDWTTTSGPNGTDTTDVWLWDENDIFNVVFFDPMTDFITPRGCNGAVGFPAGWYQTNETGDPAMISGPPYPIRSGQLVSPPIDCSNFTSVDVKFTSNFRGLNGTSNTNLGMLFDYSIDGGLTWSAAEDPSADLEINVFYYDLESRIYLEGAGGQSDVRLRFTYESDFYYWILDDVTVVESPTHNMRVNNFFAIPNNAQTPASQVGGLPFRGLADIQNIGLAPQTNVNLNLNIKDASGAVVHNEDLAYNTVGINSIAGNVPFENAYTLSSTPGMYTGTYSLSADSTDFVPYDNTRNFTFQVTDTVFAKETGRTRSFAPAASNWAAGAPHSWGMGNCYHIDKGGDNIFLSSVSFGITYPADLAGQSINVRLYKWDNTNGDDVVQEGERRPVGFNQYLVDGDEPDEAVINLPLRDIVSDSYPIILEDDTDYIVMVEYTAPDDQTDLFLEVSEDYDYIAQIFMNSPLGLAIDEPRWGSILAIPTDGNFDSMDYSTSTLGTDLVATIRMHIGSWPVSTENLSDDNIVNIFPNPANENITLELGLVNEAKDALIMITDIMGRTLFVQQYDRLKDEVMTFDISDYAEGAYMLNVATEEGTKTQKFIIQH